MADDLRKDGAENVGKGLGKEAEGRARNVVGGMKGDSSEQIKGKVEELEGKAQRKIGKREIDTDRNESD